MPDQRQADADRVVGQFELAEAIACCSEQIRSNASEGSNDHSSNDTRHNACARCHDQCNWNRMLGH